MSQEQTIIEIRGQKFEVDLREANKIEQYQRGIIKKVYQTKFGYPDGNCFEACLASIFDMNIEQIPNFGKRSDWWDKFTDWAINKLNVQPIDIEITSEMYKLCCGYHLINGESKSGNWWHSVVGKNGRIVHDPHPEKALKNKKTYTLFLKIIN